jgi:hypothetical protein
VTPTKGEQDSGPRPRAAGSDQGDWRGRRTSVIALGFLLIALIAAVYFGPQTLYCLQMRHIVGPPWWSKAPQPLDVTTMSAGPGTALSYFGYRFEAPWAGVEKEENEGRWSRVFFKTGQDILFRNPDYAQSDPLPRNGAPFAQHTSGSEYEHLETILSMTPSRLSPFRSRRNFARDRAYWESKCTLLEHSGATDIFSIRTGTYKGFETSAISYNNSAEITLFDASDREFILKISGPRGSHSTLTQPEINRVIQSFAPDPLRAPGTVPR